MICLNVLQMEIFFLLAGDRKPLVAANNGAEWKLLQNDEQCRLYWQLA